MTEACHMIDVMQSFSGSMKPLEYNENGINILHWRIVVIASPVEMMSTNSWPTQCTSIGRQQKMIKFTFVSPLGYKIWYYIFLCVHPTLHDWWSQFNCYFRWQKFTIIRLVFYARSLLRSPYFTRSDSRNSFIHSSRSIPVRDTPKPLHVWSFTIWCLPMQCAVKGGHDGWSMYYRKIMCIVVAVFHLRWCSAKSIFHSGTNLPPFRWIYYGVWVFYHAHNRLMAWVPYS